MLLPLGRGEIKKPIREASSYRFDQSFRVSRGLKFRVIRVFGGQKRPFNRHIPWLKEF
jgi:hypothetical protein